MPFEVRFFLWFQLIILFRILVLEIDLRYYSLCYDGLKIMTFNISSLFVVKFFHLSPVLACMQHLIIRD